MSPLNIRWLFAPFPRVIDIYLKYPSIKSALIPLLPLVPSQNDPGHRHIIAVLGIDTRRTRLLTPIGPGPPPSRDGEVFYGPPSQHTRVGLSGWYFLSMPHPVSGPGGSIYPGNRCTSTDAKRLPFRSRTLITSFEPSLLSSGADLRTLRRSSGVGTFPLLESHPPVAVVPHLCHVHRDLVAGRLGPFKSSSSPAPGTPPRPGPERLAAPCPGRPTYA